MTTAFDAAREIGKAVLYEGHLRRQSGVLMPPAFASPQAGDYAGCRVECLLEPRSHAVMHVRLRFLQVQERLAHRRRDDGTYERVPSLVVGDAEYATWDEVVEREIDAVLPVFQLTSQRTCIPFVVGGSERTGFVDPAVKLLHRTWPVSGELRLSAQVLGGQYGGIRLRAEVVNTTEWYEPDAPREDALRHAMLAAHLVLAVNAGRFVSLTDPPEWARPAAERCESHRLWPVLLGDTDAAVLATPVALDDHPSVTSEGELREGAGIDEIATMRIRYLRKATGEDPNLTWWDPGAVSPETDEVVISGVAVAAGSRVRLRDGRIATVRAVLSDVEGNRHLEMTVNGNYRYLTPEEIEPLR